MIILLDDILEFTKKNKELEEQNTELKKDNDTLIETQQGLKAEIKRLSSTDKPKSISGYKSGSIKYVRQSRMNKK